MLLHVCLICKWAIVYLQACLFGPIKIKLHQWLRRGMKSLNSDTLMYYLSRRFQLATKSECSFVFFLRLSSDTSEPMVPEDSLRWTTSLSPRSAYLTLTTTNCLTHLPPPPHLQPQTHPRLQPYPRPQLRQPTPVRYLIWQTLKQFC